MIKANVFEIKARLSEYLDRAAAGERIVICRHNHPVAELRPVAAARAEPRPVGPIPGRPTFDLGPAFFAPLSADELSRWEGGAPSLEKPRAVSRRVPARGGSKVAEGSGAYRAAPKARARRRS